MKIKRINLNRREKYAVGASAFLVFLFLTVQLVVNPLLEKRDRLRRMLDVKSRTIEGMAAERAKYDALIKQIQSSRERLARRKKSFSLFAFLDELAGDTGIKNKIKYMKPSSTSQKDSPIKTSMVEMKMEGITLKQLTVYLYQVETSPNTVFVRRISISKAEKVEGLVDAVLQVETYET